MYLHTPPFITHHCEQYATQPTSASYLGIYLLWATMTILSTRVYLNLVFLARGVSEHMTAEVSHIQFAPTSQLGGIKMRVQTTTVGDDNHILTMSDGRRQSHMLFTKFADAVSTCSPRLYSKTQPTRQPFDVESFGSPHGDELATSGQMSPPRSSVRLHSSYAVDTSAHELHLRV